jgi:starch synthase (maltosyl-transferring)
LLDAAEGGAAERARRITSGAAAEPAERERLLLSEEFRVLMAAAATRRGVVRHPVELVVVVERQAARYAAWYELFPRSEPPPGRASAGFADVVRRLPYVRDLGFDVLYFPPIHPIGRTNRKGRNNSLAAEPGEPGSPYAIGAAEGGHTAIDPGLGELEDFRRLVAAAESEGLEIALDFAIQCSPDHPWLSQHPNWFDWRADGSLRYAENPPKKYEDIVNVDFDKGHPDLWLALRDVVLFWIAEGVRIFRVDNPHTKPVIFWEWLIAEIHDRHPDVIFLSEAFTRPKMMRKLAKIGFSQSYSYFTWRNTKYELTDYFTELCAGPSGDYLRPNLFANTPDINPRFLQSGGRAAFMLRAVLAATLSSAFGIYSGFELCEAEALPGREEYLNSEKYEIRRRNWDAPGNIRDYIATLNRIRRDNPALHDFRNLTFYNAFDDHILLYGKMTARLDNCLLVAVNLDPHTPHGCDFELPLWEFDLPDHEALAVEDLFTGTRWQWRGKIQHLSLDPASNPAAIWRLSRIIS